MVKKNLSVILLFWELHLTDLMEYVVCSHSSKTHIFVWVDYNFVKEVSILQTYTKEYIVYRSSWKQALLTTYVTILAR